MTWKELKEKTVGELISNFNFTKITVTIATVSTIISSIFGAGVWVGIKDFKKELNTCNSVVSSKNNNIEELQRVISDKEREIEFQTLRLNELKYDLQLLKDLYNYKYERYVK
jgi:DNA repair ATPase RecN